MTVHWLLGAKERVDKAGDDFVAWRWMVEREDGDFPVEVRISRTAIAAAREEGDLPTDVREAVDTDGVLALTDFAGWPRPPEVVYVMEKGITSDGGRPPDPAGGA